MGKNDFIEQIIGGIFAIIAVGAAIAELVINGISSATIASCIKDVFGTLAIVILFFAVMRDIIPGFRFKKILLSAIENWEKENSNMIVRKPEHDDGEKGKKYYSLDMKTDVSDFYDNGSHNKTGLFVRIPVIDKSNYKNAFEITFSMNKGTFFGDVREELKDSNYREVAKRFEDFINAKYRDTVSASYKTAKIILDTDKFFELEGYRQNGHYCRFLYRAMKFSEQYTWFELSDYLQKEVEKFKAYLARYCLEQTLR